MSLCTENAGAFWQHQHSHHTLFAKLARFGSCELVPLSQSQAEVVPVDEGQYA